MSPPSCTRKLNSHMAGMRCAAANSMTRLRFRTVRASVTRSRASGLCASLAFLRFDPLRRLGRLRLGRALDLGRRLRFALLRLALLWLFRRRGLGRSGGRSLWCVRCGQHGRLTLGALGSDDDGVRETFGPAVVAQDLVGLGAARTLEGDLLELVLEP